MHRDLVDTRERGTLGRDEDAQQRGAQHDAANTADDREQDALGEELANDPRPART